MSTFLEITPRDPIIARDGRPFNAGSRMKSLDWPYPSVTAGSLRTMVGKARGVFKPEELRSIEVAGALPVRDGGLCFPWPLDCVLRQQPPAALPARPFKEWRGRTNLPPDLSPVVLSADTGDDFKPDPPPAFVGIRLIEKWLLGQGWQYPFATDATLISSVPLDERTHVALDSDRGAAEESMLYTTAALALPDDCSLQLRTAQAGMVEGVHVLGGERRLASWRRVDPPADGWTCPPDLAQSLQSATTIRLVLATPAAFDAGWAPAWLLSGEPVPGTGVKLKLVGACVGRGRPISGWSLEDGRAGPKPSRRLAPAGSTYFCELTEGSGRELAGAWLHAVSDREQDRKDGFGLALWGRWPEEGRSA